MKKTIAALLALVMLLTLAGCFGGKTFDPKTISLNNIRKDKSKAVSSVFVLKYNSRADLTEAVDHPEEGYLYIVVFPDGDYDLSVCKSNGRVQRIYNHETLFQAAKEAKWQGEDFEKAVFLERAYEAAKASTARGIVDNVWYRFSPDETQALREGK